MPLLPSSCLRSLCLAAAAASVFALPVRSSAVSAPANPNGTQLLQAELPANTPVTQATCEQLSRAVTLAAQAHRSDAAAILTAALTRGTRKGAAVPETKLPCTWVNALLHAAVVAVPGKASSLMELASSLYPDCAESLQKSVEAFDDKNVVDDKTVVDDKNGPAAARPAATNPAAANNGNAGTAGPSDLNVFDPETRDLNYAGGFGNFGGFGPGFPGAPGFVGSPPGGGVSLPTPTAPSVTPVAND